jgi:hypothetical protein
VDEDIYQAVVKKKNLAALIIDRYRRRKVEQTSMESKTEAVKTALLSIISPHR